MPPEIDEYVHRIGRTGRLGHTGRAISFYEEGQDSALLAPLVGILTEAGQNVPDFFKNGGGDCGVSNGFSSTDMRPGNRVSYYYYFILYWHKERLYKCFYLFVFKNSLLHQHQSKQMKLIGINFFYSSCSHFIPITPL